MYWPTTPLPPAVVGVIAPVISLLPGNKLAEAAVMLTPVTVVPETVKLMCTVLSFRIPPKVALPKSRAVVGPPAAIAVIAVLMLATKSTAGVTIKGVTVEEKTGALELLVRFDLGLKF